MAQTRAPSLALRAVLALALLVGFYVLALGTAAGLLFLVYLQIAGGFISAYFIIICIFGSAVIIWSIFPRIDRFTPPGPRLRAEEQPRLFVELSSIAQKVGQTMPAEVYLIPDVNAFVAQRGGILGLGSRRVMGIGLPLLQVLTVSQLRATIAHEFGHYDKGDTSLGPLIYKTRGAIIRTATGLRGQGILQAPFRGYAVLYLRITQAISRRQEYAADALAARVAGTRNMQNALKAIQGAVPAWVAYWNNEVGPVVTAGFMPPLTEGFGKFTRSRSISEQVARILEKEIVESKTNPYDSHPALRDRLAAMQNPAYVEAQENEGPAFELVDNTVQLEMELMRSVAKRLNLKELKAISWAEVVEKVYIPAWRSMVSQRRAALDGVTPESLSVLALQPGSLIDHLPGTAFLTAEQRTSLAAQTAGAAITLALLERGWEVTASPGATISLKLEGKTIQPFSIFSRLAARELTAEEWLNICRVTGIAGLDLGKVTGNTYASQIRIYTS